MRVGAAVLNKQVGDSVDWQWPYLSNIRGIVQHTGINDFAELKRLIDELEWGDQHIVKGSRLGPQVK